VGGLGQQPHLLQLQADVPGLDFKEEVVLLLVKRPFSSHDACMRQQGRNVLLGES